jgi:hypothetical protein
MPLRVWLSHGDERDRDPARGTAKAAPKGSAREVGKGMLCLLSGDARLTEGKV